MLAGLDPHSQHNGADIVPRHADPDAAANSAGWASKSRWKRALSRRRAIDETPAGHGRRHYGANDLITKLDEDRAGAGLTLNQAVEKMRGPVTHQDQRSPLCGRANGQGRSRCRSPVDIIRVPRRPFSGRGYVGYIRITHFNEQTTET